MERKHILVIDDDEVILRGFKETLELDGYSVDTAKTGKEAIEKAKLKFYNLALIDIRLPDMDGTQLLTALPETTPRMVKIIVTGYPCMNNAVEAVNQGADGYVVKPIMDMDEFLKKIEEHLTKQEESRQYGEQKIAEFVEKRLKQHLTGKKKRK